jgi:hypothetical protein
LGVQFFPYKAPSPAPSAVTQNNSKTMGIGIYLIGNRIFSLKKDDAEIELAANLSIRNYYY